MDGAYNRRQQLNFVGDLEEQAEVSICPLYSNRQRDEGQVGASFNKSTLYPTGIVKGEKRYNIDKENGEKELQKCPFQVFQ